MKWINLQRRLVLNYFMIEAFTLLGLSVLAEGPSHARYAEYSVPPLPPTALNLVELEVGKRKQEQLDSIGKAVDKAITKQPEQTKKTHTKAVNKKHPENHKINEAKKNNPVADDAEREASIILNKQYQDQALVDKKISVSFRRVDIRKALELIRKLSDITFLIDSDIQGSIPSFEFNDISLATALSILLENNNPQLALLKDNGTWRILKREKGLDIVKMRFYQEQKESMTTDSLIIYHAVWDDEFKKRIEQLWKGIVGKDYEKLGHYLVFDDHGKKILFRGSKPQRETLISWVKEIDIRIPQVRIDARVLVAQKDFEEAIGFEWSGIYDRKASVKHFDFAGVGIGKIEGEPTNTFSRLLHWSLNFIPDVVNPFTIKLPFVFGGKDFPTKRLNILLNAAENRNEVKTILKPSLLIQNQQVAEILVGQEMPQEVRLQETVEGNPTNITTVGYKDIGMKIKIKPIVTPDLQSVFLDVFIENSAVVKAQALRNGNTIAEEEGDDDRHYVRPSRNSLCTRFNYTIQTSRSQSRVVLNSGQTTLIGGLIIKTDEFVKSGIPFLQDVPVVGWFFQGRRKASVDKQLLIFLTPTLI